MLDPVISIVMPVRNGEERLRRAISSVKAQTFHDWELVAVDDGSEDETPAILKQAASSDWRVRTLRQEPSGIATALNNGIEHACGEWIARFDSDDLMHPERLRRQFDFARARPDLVVTGCLVSLNAEMPLAEKSGMMRFIDWVNALVEPEEIAREIFIDCPVPHPTFFVRRNLLAEHGGYHEGDEPEDYELILRLHSRGLRFGKLPEVLLQWTDWQGRASRVADEYSAEAFRRLKGRYLAQMNLIGPSSFYVWGAGEVGKAFARVLVDQGCPPVALVDIDPRKIGHTIHGCPVLDPAGLLSARRAGQMIICAVGAPGARDDIRRELNASGLRERRDYLFAA